MAAPEFSVTTFVGEILQASANLFSALSERVSSSRISCLAVDDTLPDAAKYKQFRLMTVSFPPVRVTEAP
jgi:hypothetical protein